MPNRLFLLLLLTAVMYPAPAAVSLTFLGDNNSTYSTLTGATGFTRLGDDVYFSALGLYGTELYRTDGTTDSCELVKDINQGPGSSSPDRFVTYNGNLYFFADDGLHGPELWRTDGTAEGSSLVKDIRSNGGTYGSNTPLATSNGLVFYAQYDTGGNGTLFRSDGTSSGTSIMNSMLKVQTSGTNPFAALDNFVFFSGAVGNNDYEPWQARADLGALGPISDIWTGSESSRPENFVASNGKMFFVADSYPYGFELWCSDHGNVFMVADIAPGIANASPRNLIDVNGTLYFTAYETSGSGIWKTDGMLANTSRIKDFTETGNYPVSLAKLGNGLLCSTSNTSGTDSLWYSDGTAAGTDVIYSGLTASLPVDVNGTAYFSGRTADRDFELWQTDGTFTGTTITAEAGPIGPLKNPTSLTAIGSDLYFTADGPGTISAPMKLAGGSRVPVSLHAFPSAEPANFRTGVFKVAADYAYFSAWDGEHGTELWASDGTRAGTRLIKDIVPGIGSSDAVPLIQLNGLMYFYAHLDNNHGYLWKTDGTSVGTSQVAAIEKPVAADASSTHLYLLTDAFSGYKAYRSDGTASGTLLIDSNSVSIQSRFYGLGNGAVFLGSTTETGTEPYYIDNSSTSPALLKDIYPGKFYSTFATLNPVIDQQRIWLYFQATDNIYGSELWRTNGSSEGTTMVKDLTPGLADSSIAISGALIDGNYYFNTSPGAESPGYQWVSDGTATGTIKLAETGPVTNYWLNKNYIKLGEKVLFQSNDAASGQELWITDGTPEGTMMLADIQPGAAGSAPDYFFNAGQFVYFTADDGTHGRELWKTDGTPAGTTLVHDIRPGIESSDAGQMTLLGNHLIFSANDGSHGQEIWYTEIGSEMASLIQDIEPGPYNSVTPTTPLLAIGSTVVFSAFNSALGSDLWSISEGASSAIAEWKIYN